MTWVWKSRLIAFVVADGDNQRWESLGKDGKVTAGNLALEVKGTLINLSVAKTRKVGPRQWFLNLKSPASVLQTRGR
ncbi:MAG: hypothetical protein CM15mP120_28320 [Pseudomonadota bacterium]|nr:MAG: hypothetical protein CM15mP120_28320 [Pseudomonadota bacterium]